MLRAKLKEKRRQVQLNSYAEVIAKLESKYFIGDLNC
jgi:hypothetical protein